MTADRDVTQIGFNTEVQQGERSLHVQTEIIARGGTKIRTTVTHRGAILHVSSSPFELERSLDDCRRIAQTVHARIVERVTLGEIT